MADMENVSFRCYAYRKSENCYVAYCLDLMLIGEGATMQGAVADLEESIHGYVEAAYKTGWENDLIPRRARVGRWLEFYWLLFVHALGALVTMRFGGFQIFEERLEAGVGGERRLAHA
jgi:predicted RNase H-like HicB family nuclease